MLTTIVSSSTIAKMKSQIHLRSVSLSIPPHMEHKTCCLQYSFMNDNVHKRCSIIPPSGSKSYVTRRFHSEMKTITLQPKCSRNSLSSVSTDRLLSGLRLQISLALRNTSSVVTVVGHNRFFPRPPSPPSAVMVAFQ
jgi:hypothetical protein